MNNIFKNKKIIVGITGSIAAYKSPLLIRELVKSGAEVFPMMTPAAAKFVTPLTISNLSRNPVIIEMFDDNQQKGGAWHIHTAHNCDAMVIAPCSATTMAKIANGICDNSLVTVAIALPRTIPLLISPAMDFSMWQHPATQRNLKTLETDGAIIIPPEEGELSSGLSGPGRMPDINVIMDYLAKSLSAE